MFTKHITDHTETSQGCKSAELCSVLGQNFEAKANKTSVKSDLPERYAKNQEDLDWMDPKT